MFPNHFCEKKCTYSVYDEVKYVFTHGKASIGASRHAKELEVFWGQAAFSAWWVQVSSGPISILNGTPTDRPFAHRLMRIIQKKLSEVSRFIRIAFGGAPVYLEPLVLNKHFWKRNNDCIC